MLLPGAGIMGSLPWPPSIYVGSGDLLSVPCVCTTNIWSTEPDPQTQHWLSCPPTTRRAPLFPAPLHRVLEMTEPWDHALKLLNFESQYLLLPLKGGKKKKRGERETRKPQTWQRNMMGPYNMLLAPTCLARKEFSRAQRSSEWQLFSFEVWGRRGVDSNSSTFKKRYFIYFYLMCMSGACMHVCAPRTCLVYTEARKRVLDPQELGFTYGYDSLCVCRELNLHPIQEQQTLLTTWATSTPQPLFMRQDLL